MNASLEGSSRWVRGVKMAAVLISLGGGMAHGATQTAVSAKSALLGSAVPEVVGWALALIWVVGNLCALEFVAALRRSRREAKVGNQAAS